MMDIILVFFSFEQCILNYTLLQLHYKHRKIIKREEHIISSWKKVKGLYYPILLQVKPSHHTQKSIPSLVSLYLFIYSFKTSQKRGINTFIAYHPSHHHHHHEQNISPRNLLRSLSLLTNTLNTTHSLITSLE